MDGEYLCIVSCDVITVCCMLVRVGCKKGILHFRGGFKMVMTRLYIYTGNDMYCAVSLK